MTESFYDLLGVPADADVDEIRRAYRQRIKETHPDVSDDPDASEKTARIVEARDVLTDEDERDRYDRLGHEAYVDGGNGTKENDSQPWTSQAAAEAADSSSSAAGPTNARASAEERRRERRAREDVDFGTDDKHDATASNGGTATSGTTGTTSGTTSASTTGSKSPSGGSTDGGSTQSRPGGSSVSATRGPPPWSDTSQGWAARSPTNAPPGLARHTVTAVREAPATAIVTFFLYPLLVLGAFFPPFPLLVNVIVGACLLAMIGAAQSVAGLGIAIYGAWTVLGTIGVIVAGASPFSPLGIVVLGTTWLPLGFSMLTYQVLDS